jgi:16S rRNA (cytosine1402-N4)-methyltransferase
MPDRTDENVHRSVLLDETLQMLAPQRGGTYVDATLGMAGHSVGILGRFPETVVIGLDQDAEALELANRRLSRFSGRFKTFQANFEQIGGVLRKANVGGVSGVMADLGISSLQVDSETRGFSFRFDAPLDMRMDPSSGDATAADLLGELPEEDIANLIYKFGEERHSRRIARRIVERRNKGVAVASTKELADLVASVVRRGKHDKIHPATKTFQALRIAVNREIDALEKFIPAAIDVLDKDGRLAIITFHSIEDRIVKQAFLKFSGRCSCPPRMPKCICGAAKIVEILTKKPIVPGEEEIEANPRARSAKLRAVRKLEL